MRNLSFPNWIVGLALAAMLAQAFAQSTNSPSESELAYTRTLAQRAEKIVTPLGLSDSAKSNRVHGIIVQQYRDLREIHDARDAKIKTAKSQAAANKEAAAAATKAAQD